MTGFLSIVPNKRVQNLVLEKMFYKFKFDLLVLMPLFAVEGYGMETSKCSAESTVPRQKFCASTTFQ